MLELDAEPLCSAIGILERVRGILEVGRRDGDAFHRNIERDGRSTLITDLEKVRTSAKALNLRLTVMSLERVLERLKAEKDFTWEEVSIGYAVVLSRFRDEFASRRLVVIDEHRVRYYSSSEPLFGVDFDTRFVSAAFELDEAAKCLALGRPTAAVFHLMRILEIGVRATARCLQIPDPTRPMERNWGYILTEIWNHGILVKWPTTRDRIARDGALFEELYASLDAVKNPWRNATMHVERKYTDDEAEHVFVAVKGFMMKLASRCDEEGKPLA